MRIVLVILSLSIHLTFSQPNWDRLYWLTSFVYMNYEEKRFIKEPFPKDIPFYGVSVGHYQIARGEDGSPLFYIAGSQLLDKNFNRVSDFPFNTVNLLAECTNSYFVKDFTNENSWYFVFNAARFANNPNWNIDTAFNLQSKLYLYSIRYQNGRVLSNLLDTLRCEVFTRLAMDFEEDNGGYQLYFCRTAKTLDRVRLNNCGFMGQETVLNFEEGVFLSRACAGSSEYSIDFALDVKNKVMAIALAESRWDNKVIRFYDLKTQKLLNRLPSTELENLRTEHRRLSRRRSFDRKYNGSFEASGRYFYGNTGGVLYRFEVLTGDLKLYVTEMSPIVIISWAGDKMLVFFRDLAVGATFHVIEIQNASQEDAKLSVSLFSFQNLVDGVPRAPHILQYDPYYSSLINIPNWPEVSKPPIPKIEGEGLVCHKDLVNLQAIDLGADSAIWYVDSVQVGSGFSWSGSFAPGSHEVMVKTVTQCLPNYAFKTITAVEFPKQGLVNPQNVASDTVLLCSGSSIELEGKPEQHSQFLWQNGSKEKKFVASGGELAVFIQQNPCGERRDTLVIRNESLFLPNIITPNGDGKNDRFEIPGQQESGAFVMQLFNRWGAEVFKGRVDEMVELDNGVYYYHLESRLGCPYKGWLEVRR
ncbi:MAG: gliding motility-associated C-terminal domain-containing protein [Cytophagales bacterium]